MEKFDKYDVSWRYNKYKKDIFSAIDIEKDSLSSVESLTVIIDIEIKSIYGINNEEIPRCKWSKHNIIV